jgi:hypothetical protein
MFTTAAHDKIDFDAIELQARRARAEFLSLMVRTGFARIRKALGRGQVAGSVTAA